MLSTKTLAIGHVLGVSAGGLAFLAASSVSHEIREDKARHAGKTLREMRYYVPMINTTVELAYQTIGGLALAYTGSITGHLARSACMSRGMPTPTFGVGLLAAVGMGAATIHGRDALGVSGTSTNSQHASLAAENFLVCATFAFTATRPIPSRALACWWVGILAAEGIAAAKWHINCIGFTQSEFVHRYLVDFE